jgi:hypothetical protein
MSACILSTSPTALKHGVSFNFFQISFHKLKLLLIITSYIIAWTVFSLCTYVQKNVHVIIVITCYVNISVGVILF